MEELKNLEALGLVLPSPVYMVSAILFGIVGYISFRRGRKISNLALTWTGGVLMVYPYVISQTWLLWVVGVVLSCWIFVKWN